MRKVHKSGFFFVTFVLLSFILLSSFGLNRQWGDIKKVYVKSAEDLHLGVDFAGGVCATLKPQHGVNPSQTHIILARNIIKQRLFDQNLSGGDVLAESDSGNLIVLLPWQQGLDKIALGQTLEDLTKTANITFREGDERDDQGKPAGETLSNVILTDDDIKKARVGHDSEFLPSIQFSLTAKGSENFAKATEKIAKEFGKISIWLDNDLISAPTVESKIDGGMLSISGWESKEKTKRLADLINSKALPFELISEDISFVEPNLGKNATVALLQICGIALVATALFMVLKYRISGCVFVFTLISQLSILFSAFTGFFPKSSGLTITVPSVMGVFVSCLLGVFSNIFVAEHIQEGLRLGKTSRTAVDTGVKSGTWLTLGSNFVLLVFAKVLTSAFAPSSSIFSEAFQRLFSPLVKPALSNVFYVFGLTLTVGVIANLIVNLFAARYMLRTIVRFKSMKKASFFASSKLKKLPHDVKFLGVQKSALLTLLGLAVVVATFTACNTKLISPTSNSSSTVISCKYQGPLDRNKIESFFESEFKNSSHLLQTSNFETGSLGFMFFVPMSSDSERFSDLNTKLRGLSPQTVFEDLKVSKIEPFINQNFLLSCALVAEVSLVVAVLFMAFWFHRIGGFSCGLALILALLQDLTIVLGIVALFRNQLGSIATIAVFSSIIISAGHKLLVLGKIKENQKLLNAQLSARELVNKSANQAMKPTVFSGLMALTVGTIMCSVAFYYDIPVVFESAFIFTFGVLYSLISTIFVFAPLVATCLQTKLKRDIKRQKAKLAKKSAKAIPLQ